MTGAAIAKADGAHEDEGGKEEAQLEKYEERMKTKKEE